MPLQRLVKWKRHKCRMARFKSRPQRAQIESPDLIFLDIMIPSTDPFGLLFRLKGNDRTHRIPIFITSGASDTEQRDLCHTFGALEFIEKPYEIAEVATLVARALG